MAPHTSNRSALSIAPTSDLYKLAAELVVDDIVQPLSLRSELISRFNAYASKEQTGYKKKRSVLPV